MKNVELIGKIDSDKINDILDFIEKIKK